MTYNSADHKYSYEMGMDLCKPIQMIDPSTGLYAMAPPISYSNKQQQHPQIIRHLSTFTSPKSSTPQPNNKISNQKVHNVRFAVNGLSKFAPGNQIPSINKSIQAGDFGDDSGMLTENSSCVVIGLADGAGGNRSIGIDPKIFSRSLLSNCADLIKKEQVLFNEMPKLACKSVHVLERNNIEGSGTLCLLSLNKKNNIMHTMNMGDSGFRLIRNNRIVHMSKATMAGSSPKQLYVSYQHNYSGISFVREKYLFLLVNFTPTTCLINFVFT